MKIYALWPSVLLAASSTIFAQDTPPTTTTPVIVPKIAGAAPARLRQPPDVAAPKLGKDGKQTDPGFTEQHENFLKIAKKGGMDVLFLGDSITAGWNRAGKEVWTKAFSAYKPANFGIGGDRTQHVLWRITNGELDGVSPKALVLMIGTNNSGTDPAEEIAKGITKIVQTIREKTPNTKILLLAVFPRGMKSNEQREKLQQVNSVISKLDDGKNVFFLDIGQKFMQADGSISQEIMPDYLHLSPKGYQIWADAISPKLAELTK